AKDIYNFIEEMRRKYNVPIDMMTIDSADAATRNQMYKDYGIRLNPVKKKKKVNMIENVIDLLVRRRFFVLSSSNNDVFLNEHKMYTWDQDTLRKDNPKVVEEADHHPDQLQYYVQDNLRKLGLKY